MEYLTKLDKLAIAVTVANRNYEQATDPGEIARTFYALELAETNLLTYARKG